MPNADPVPAGTVADEVGGVDETLHAAWRKGVAGVLAKARRVEVADLPDEPEKLLEETTYDGLTIAPLYTRRDELPEQPLPGAFPFVRGGTATRDVHRGWYVSAFVAGDGASANREMLAGLANGLSAVWLGAGTRGVPVPELPTALSGLLFELAPLTLSAGSEVTAAAAAVFAALDGYETADRAAIQIALGAAPLTSRFAGIDDVELAEAVELAGKSIARAETVRTITVDGTVFHDAGAAEAQELGAAVAAGLEYLRKLTAAGYDTATALRQLEFRFAATDDQFATIAKFRAARQLWARVAEVCGLPAFGGAPQHAVTSAAMMSQRDPWVNLLRSTLAAFGAGVGGADTVTVLPFDSALPPGELGVSKSFSDRMARNTQLLLLEESHLGFVQDPGAGSWYVESLTADLAAKAWEFMQELETAGGYLAALDSGLLAERIAATKAARDADVAHRKTAVTGVNEFPNLGEKPLSAAAREPGRVARYGAAFEELRNRSDAYLAEHGVRPKALLVPLGSVAEHNVRVTFIANLLASGGIESINPGPLTVDGIAAAAKESGAPIAVLCGADKRYGEEAGAAVTQLRAAGVDTVLLAGAAKAVAALEESERPDGYLAARIDAVAALSGLLEKVGA
ncbi:methylmalonyl-CoA mutase family protein [Nocardia goodfellowii]|uniref:Methylmalonyl-CoA mutase n=1 Tax=Nocardia goodfellowii TaxID=882446 RepID=A0ABS4QIG3_9NOCA|nr:methylmalonyl-CoA mutase family protein [Nocardia goodfellowii]MBP2190883.1 methylmalonyl-CoA mutase [Nocardia goodfellowii]